MVLVKHFSFRRYNKNILFAIIEQAAQNAKQKIYGQHEHDDHHYHRHGLGHRELKRKTEQALSQYFSTGTFDMYLDLLVDSHVFTKRKHYARGGKAEYRLTKKSLQEYRAGVLQISAIEPAIEVFADEEERYRLYQLLFTIETIEPPFLEEIYDTEEGMLKRVRKFFKVRISRGDLAVQSIEREEVDCTVTHYKPVSCVCITRRDYYPRSSNKHDRTINAYKPSSQPGTDKQKAAFYYVKAEGFSVTDIMNYHKKFGFVRTHDLTKTKVKRGIMLLTKAGIVEPIRKLGDEMRYSFADNSLRQLIGSCFVVFHHTVNLLSKVWQYERKVNSQERAWLESIYGRRQADRIISDYYDFFISKGESAITDKARYNIEKEALYRLIRQETKELRQRYSGSKLLNKNPFPVDRMLEEMILPPFLGESQASRRERNRKYHGGYIAQVDNSRGYRYDYGL
jgi:hypothetical protein